MIYSTSYRGEGFSLCHNKKFTCVARYSIKYKRQSWNVYVKTFLGPHIIHVNKTRLGFKLL